MRQSPRRPLILKRRKLPFQQSDAPPAGSQGSSAASGPPEPPGPPGPPAQSQSLPGGIRIVNHPTMSDTQVVVIPRAVDVQSVIGALTARGKLSGAQGPNKFILLSESGCHNNNNNNAPFGQVAAVEGGVSTQVTTGPPVKHGGDAAPLAGFKLLNTELECGPLNNSLTNIQWLDGMSTSLHTDQQMSGKENLASNSQTTQTGAEAGQAPVLERPPYSYMAMIQFAINSRKNRKMTLKEIYTWIEDHFPFFRDAAKPGWKNSIRHNLSLHDMFTRETSLDGKVSFWTIRPEANRCLTLDQVYKPGCDPTTAPVPVPMLLFSPQHQKRMVLDARKTPVSSERRMKPLLPRTDSYLVPIQLPVASPIYLPSSFPQTTSQHKRKISRAAKRVRIAPKVTKSDEPVAAACPERSAEVKQELACVEIKRESPEAAPPKRPASRSRRKQRLVHSAHEEPVLLCPDASALFDSGVASDASTFHDGEPEERRRPSRQHSPEPDCSFKTPIKSSGSSSSSSSHLSSSTPSKPPSSALPGPWKVTPVGEGSRSVLDFSPIRTPGGPAVTPRHDYTTFSFNGTPFKDWPLFSSPRELLNSAPSDSPGPALAGGCSRELLAPHNRSLAEGLVLDTMNESLSKILVDISFSALDDDDLGMANISWSEIIPHLK